MSSKEVTACLIIIGNEILSGRTKDKNLAYLAERLNGWGVRLTEARVVPDIEQTIIDAVNECRAKFDYVFTTGGIGPTHDDITAASIAKAFGCELIKNPKAMAIMEPRFKPGEFNEARQKMACTPEGATLIENSVSAAPGFQVENVFVLAGVPSIMRAMVDTLKNRLVGGAPMLSRTITVFLSEGTVAAGLAAVQEKHDDIDIGSYPFYRDGRFGTSLVLRGVNEQDLSAAAEDTAEMVRGLGGEPHFE